FPTEAYRGPDAQVQLVRINLTAEGLTQSDRRTAQLSLLIRQRQELETQLSQLRNQLELRTAAAAREPHEPLAAGLRAEAQQLQAQVDRGQKMVKLNEQKKQEVSAQRDSTEQRMREA
ncbi:MAG: hypothetical protein ACKPJD_12045, partial [Planctomycetaceae bacterium]